MKRKLGKEAKVEDDVASDDDANDEEEDRDRKRPCVNDESNGDVATEEPSDASNDAVDTPTDAPPSRLTNTEAAAFWSAWTEENAHVMRLVDNDVVVRTRALKRLRAFLKTRSADEERPFEETDLLKIWKGLHYSMWHSDKLLVQQELAGTLAELIHCFETPTSALLFFKCFWLTIVREWEGIDAHRLNKFLTLIRRVWRSSLVFLKGREWDETLVSSALDVLRQTVIRPNASTPNGLTFHLIDVYVDELTKVGGSVGKMPTDAPADASLLNRDRIIDFLRPIIVFCLKENTLTLLKAAERDVFEELISQVEGDFVDEIGEEGFETAGRIDDGNIRGPMDRGQGLDQSGTRLDVDFARLGAYILKLAGGKRVKATNRKLLYRVATKLENLAKGVYPWEEVVVPPSDRKADGGLSKKELEEAVRRLTRENQRPVVEKRGKKGKRERRRKEEEEKEVEDRGEDEDAVNERENDEGMDCLENGKDERDPLPETDDSASEKKKGRKDPRQRAPKAPNGKKKVVARGMREKKATKSKPRVASTMGNWTVKVSS